MGLVIVLKMQLILYHSDIKDEVTLPIQDELQTCLDLSQGHHGSNVSPRFSDIKTCFNFFRQE